MRSNSCPCLQTCPIPRPSQILTVPQTRTAAPVGSTRHQPGGSERQRWDAVGGHHFLWLMNSSLPSFQLSKGHISKFKSSFTAKNKHFLGLILCQHTGPEQVCVTVVTGWTFSAAPFPRFDYKHLLTQKTPFPTCLSVIFLCVFVQVKQPCLKACRAEWCALVYPWCMLFPKFAIWEVAKSCYCPKLCWGARWQLSIADNFSTVLDTLPWPSFIY